MNPPTIALVGRPNVGKSTLFNRLVGGRNALVHDQPGLTRDRRYGEIDYFGKTFRVIDTGGLDFQAERDVIGAGIHRQAAAAMEEADILVFVIDGVVGVCPADEELARVLRKTGKYMVCAINKIDSHKRELLAAEAYRLGVDHSIPVSAVHGRGIDDLLDAIVQYLGEDAFEAGDTAEPEPTGIRVAVIGKPNAGKSSLVNRLLGQERSLVHDMPGTTTDPVDTPLRLGEQDYVLVDTAGIRRKARVDEDLEKLSVIMALGQMRRADVCVLVVDATIGASEQDARLVGMAQEHGRALVIALNKTDAVSGDDFRRARTQLSDELYFAKHVDMVAISAKTGRGVLELMDRVKAAALEHERRISTSEINGFFEEVCMRHPPPLHHGRSVRIHYLSQVRAKPPTFALWVNRPHGLAESYKRYLSNQLRQHYGFRGSPIRIMARAKVNRRGARKDQRKRR